jgi:phosphoribosyl 1,2-cyclic phosphodiesterase
MKLKVIGTGSSGNCYILETESEVLVIEAGVHLKKLKESIGFNISKISGVLISHCHGDHAKHASTYRMNGLNVIDQFDGKLEVGGFQILPFEVVHDVKTYGFLINHVECGTTCYVSDTHYLPNKLRGMNNMIIEANYSQDILDRRVSEGGIHLALRNRIIQSHMSLETLKGVMESNDLTRVNNIVLIHLSDGNSNAVQFKREITELTGKRVTIAEPGLIMDFNKEL